MLKFNQKVRRGNSKISKRRKSKGRRLSKSQGRKDQNQQKHRSSSLAKLKLRVPKISSGLPQLKAENNIDEKAEIYDPKKRGIGMEFLDYLKKKPRHKGHNVLFSAQKTTSDWGISIKNGGVSEMRKYKD